MSTSTNWYINQSGKAEGPRTTDEVRQLLSEGRISAEDRVFREGSSEWTKLREISEFVLVPSKHDESQNKNWVLLLRSQEDTFVGKPRFIQVGPLSKDEVFKKIDSGEAHLGDHVWKPGFSSWQKLSNIKDFERTHFEEPLGIDLSKEAEARSIEPTREELLASVTLSPPLKPNYVSPFEPAPQEANGNDLAQSLLPKSVVESLSGFSLYDEETKTDFEIKADTLDRTAELSLKTPEASPESVKEVPGPSSSAKKNRTLMYAGLGATVTALALSVFSLRGGVSQVPKVGPAAVSEPVAQSSAIAELKREVANARTAAPPVTSAVVPVVKAPAEAPVAKFIKIKALKLESTRPQLVFETNAQPGEAIKVQVVGKKGEILELVRFDRTTQLARQANEVPTLDLTKWDLPSGNYRVTASVKDSNAEQAVFIGQKNRKFQTSLEKHRKVLDKKAVQEKKELESAFAKLEKQAQNLSKASALAAKNKAQWNKFYAQWIREFNVLKKGSLGKFKSASESKFVYALAYQKTQMAANDLFKSGREFDEKSRSKRAPASNFQLKRFKSELGEIRKGL